MLEGHKVAFANRGHDREEHGSQRCRLRPGEQCLVREATENDVGRYEVGEDKLPMLLEHWWCLQIGLLEAVRCAHEIIAVEVEPAKVVEEGDPLCGWI